MNDSLTGSSAANGKTGGGPTLILGAGFAGLVAARELARHGIEADIFEASTEVGGLARSFRDDEGFSHDFGAHFITNRLAAQLGVSSECRVVRRYDESVAVGDRVFRYPFGLLRSPRFMASAIGGRIDELTNHREPANAAEWYEQQYGSCLADAVARPLLEAWSGASATDLATSVGDKMPGTLETLWLKAASRLTRRAVGCGYCSAKPASWKVWHVYPRFGVGSILTGLADAMEHRIRLGSPVERIHVEDGAVRGVTSRGEFHPAATVFSTAPVHILARLVDGADIGYLSEFRYRPMVFVNLMLEGRGLLQTTVVWTPEKKFDFFRLTEAPLSMPWLAPEGKTIITADVGCELDGELWQLSDEDLADRCVRQLAAIIPDVEARLIRTRCIRTRCAYPVYLNAYEEDRRRFLESTGVEGLYSIGRNGRFSHDLMEDVYWNTRRAVASAVARSGRARGAARPHGDPTDSDPQGGDQGSPTHARITPSG